MTEYLLPLIILFISSLISAVILIRLIIAPLSNLGMVDIPSKRRAHTNITPRGGGLALSLVLIVGGIFFEYIMTRSFEYSIRIILPFFLISLISFLDDIKTIPILIRFLVHLLCASSVIYALLYPVSLFHQELPLLLDFMLAALSFTAFLNIYNFLDGIDGITAAESIHLSATILILCFLKSEVIIHLPFIVSISTLICACSIGFLMFNWPPAKIFLGDVGSIGLGFLIGLCLLLIAASSERLFAASVIASLYYLADGGLTILIRLINKEKIWQPHLKHFFQKAVKRGMTHKQVVKKIILCNFILMILSVSSLYTPVISVFLSLIVVMITLIKFIK